MSEPSYELLISQYATAAARHFGLLVDGKIPAANRQYDAVVSAYAKIRKHGLEAQRAMLALLRHPDAGVRYWSASHALEFAPAEGEAALMELKKVPGLAGVNAGMMLWQWRRGGLHFQKS